MTFQYEHRVQEALRKVVHDILVEVSQKGLPEPHHFYISLRTNYPGVRFPESIKKTNPKEVTVVLQHQFWDLKVDEKGFAVVLTFQDIPQTIYVPFDALLSFMDPGVRFGLHFTPPPVLQEAGDLNDPSITPLASQGKTPQPSLKGQKDSEKGEKETERPEGAMAQVISLETFRS